jgi:hypothetical protein
VVIQLHDGFERGEQVGVAGEDHQGVVLAAEAAVHQVHGERDIDALLLRRPVRPVSVVEHPADDMDSRVAGPL